MKTAWASFVPEGILSGNLDVRHVCRFVEFYCCLGIRPDVWIFPMFLLIDWVTRLCPLMRLWSWFCFVYSVPVSLFQFYTMVMASGQHIIIDHVRLRFSVGSRTVLQFRPTAVSLSLSQSLSAHVCEDITFWWTVKQCMGRQQSIFWFFFLFVFFFLGHAARADRPVWVFMPSLLFVILSSSSSQFSCGQQIPNPFFPGKHKKKACLLFYHRGHILF